MTCLTIDETTTMCTDDCIRGGDDLSEPKSLFNCVIFLRDNYL